ncbi:nucleolin isoform X2 [Osmerus eperlanus]|uniref:nucleolin isoform X2 n=1 Tax=Osmerus eperlanus TaxID=29151 RepID=UPI002E1142CD
MVKLAKAAKKQANPKKKAPPPPKEVEEESSEEESEEEEVAPPPKAVKKAAAKAKPTPVKAAKNGKAAKKAESEDDEESDGDSEEESEEEAPPAKKTPAKPTPAKAAPAKAAEESDEEDDDDEDDESEEEEKAPAPKKATPAKPAVKVTPAKEESDDEEDDDEVFVSSDAPVTPAKRKAENKETPPAKKAKSDGEGGFCLFVGNLNGESKDFDEIKEALGAFFSKKNLDVQEVRLGASRKFGYVDFATEEDLQKAIELSGKKFMGQELKLDRARSKESSQEGKKERDARTLFVKNLPFSATADDLKEVFENAVDIRLPPGQNGSNRGIAYVEFKTEAIADKMLEEAQGAEVQGRSIIVDYTGDKSQKGGRPAAAPGAASKTLVVNNLSYNATEDSLQSLFEKAVAVRVPQNNGRPKGFAFVEFESAEEAKEAMDSLNGSEIEGRAIRLEYSQNSGGKQDGGRGSSGPTKTLFVRGLSEDTTDGTLRDSFEGAVAARIVTDRDTGSSKGFGFVDFDNEQDCKTAKEAMEDGEIDGSKVTLDYAKPKGEGGFRGGRGGGGFGGGGFGGRGGGGRGGRGGFGRGGGGGGGFRGGRGGNRGGGRGFGGGRGGGGFGGKPQGKKIKFDD